MAQIDPTALIHTHIAFAKASENYDSEKDLMMRPSVKNCTMLVPSTYEAGQTLPHGCERTVHEREEEEAASNSSSGSSSSIMSPLHSTGLRMIQIAYGGRNNSPLPRSPPAAISGEKRLKLNLSSTSSSPSSSVSSISIPSTTSVSSCLRSPKNYLSSDTQQKSAGKYLKNTYLSSTMSKSLRQCDRDSCPSPDKFVKKSSLIFDEDKNRTVSRSGYSGYDADKPSTSKNVIREATVMPNGALKRRLDYSDDSLIPNKHRDSQENRTFNGRIERKRLLSERSELEAKFPILDRTILHATWQGSHILNPDGRNTGVGLCNYANDCFLNAVLQLIVHTAPLARYVGEQHASFSCAKDCFICDLGLHVRHAMMSKTAFKPTWIDSHLRRIFPSHCPGVQEDAHELLNLLLDALDSAAMKGASYLSRNFGEPRPSTPVEQIFGGTLRNQIRCLNCSNILINYERIRELNLGLKMQNYEGRIRMDDLLGDYFGNETLCNFDCRKCKRKTQIQRSSRILRAPFVLLIQLKRFSSFGSKICCPVNVELTLRLDPYMYKSSEPHVYQLNGLVQHLGNGMDHGHYNAAVRGFDGRSWYMFDDDQRHKMSMVELHNIQAYLLLYIRREVPKDQIPSSSKVSDMEPISPSKNRLARRPYVQGYPAVNQ